MKCTIPEISWHNREPILSADAFPVKCGDFYKLATGGSDTFICIWQLKIIENGAVTIDILSELTRHQKAVNVVRWSPNGNYLASGDDDANIIIWQLKTDNVPLLEGDNDCKETWIVYKILRGHKEDVYDISWSPDGSKLLTGSVDNTAILWDVNKGKNEIILTDHKGFVQGVAWDPKNEFIATLSSDRICRIFNPSGKQVRARICRGLLPVKEEHDFHGKDVKYFHDDTFKTFFRRLNFSPDGNLLVIPSGSIETEECKNAMYATYIFTLDSFKQPAIILPTPKQCSIVVRCSPVLYELRPNIKPYIDLPYRMLIAVATDSDVILYDTQQISPFAQLHNIHYTRLTDLTWSHDGLLLTASSTDGFITLVTFEENELGLVYKKDESEEEVVEKSIVVEEVEKKVETNDEKEKEKIKSIKRSSFIEQWAKQAPISTQKRKAEEEPMSEAKKLKNETKNATDKQNENTDNNVVHKSDVIVISDSPIKSTNAEITENTPKKQKRITPITLKAVTPKKVKRNDSDDIIKKSKVDDDIHKKEDGQGKVSKKESEGAKSSSKVDKINSPGKEEKNLNVNTSSNSDAVTHIDTKETQSIDLPKESKRAQLITLRLGSEKETCKNVVAQVKANTIGNMDNKQDTIKTTTFTEEIKPKKRATLIKIGECSNKTEKKSSVEDRFFTKLIALDKTETGVVKSSDDENDDEKSSSQENDEINSECNDILITESEHSSQGSSAITAQKENQDNSANVKQTPVDYKEQVLNIEQEKTNVKENNELKSKNNEATTTGVNQSRNDNENKESKTLCKTIEDGDSKLPTIFKEAQQIKKSKDNEKVLEISDDENTINKSKQAAEDKIKSPFPLKKTTSLAVTPKQATKKTPKAEDKSNQSSSTGKNKKKQSVTPKMSLLNFFKPISSSEKVKGNESEINEEGKMKPTSLFKETVTDDNKGSQNLKDNVIVIDCDDDNEKCEVIKVKTSSLFKKNKNKQFPEDEIEGVKKITSPKRRSKSKMEQPQKTVELMEDDSVPADFCLQIEDSRDIDNEINFEKEKPNDVEDSKSGEMRLDNMSKNKTEKDHKLKEYDGIENVKENKAGSEVKEGEKYEKDEVKLEKMKLPRRVPLITLASPKSKRKVADT